MHEPYQILSAIETMKILKTSTKGLKSSEAKERLAKYGYNELYEKKKKSDFDIFLDQFKSFLILILIVAVVISFAFGKYIDALLILAIILLNSFLSYIQIKKAEEAVRALKKLTIPTVKVIRDGNIKIISSRELVPGDFIILNTGDRVPADCRLISQINLKVDESILTGESHPVSKVSVAIKDKQSRQNHANMLFMGTSVVYGRCEAVVVSTGMNTEFGKIAMSIQTEEDITPLQKKLDRFGRFLGILFLTICAIVFVIGLVNAMDLITIALTAISLAVAAVPEGLLASITIALSLGVNRMAKYNAIVKKLTAVEGLGSVTTICTDKTGTLTVNEMTVKYAWTYEKEYVLTGEGYKREGKILLNDKEISKIDRDLSLLLEAGLYCNDAFITTEPIGDPTELALLVSARKARISDYRSNLKRLDEIQFDSKRKMMSVLYPSVTDKHKRIIWSKGATEKIIEKCSFILKDGKIRKISSKDKLRIMEKEQEYAKSSFRVLALAMKQVSGNKIQETGFVFLGLQAMIDPPRPEVKNAISVCKKAGIDVIMITGDHKETALAIGKELGIVDSGIALMGHEIDEMSDSELKKKISKVKIFARVSPEHKVRITRILKEKGEIVAMTGDGINDAPALKAADVGVAMGQTGTDVTREVADLVISDDNFATIVKAIEQGRGIYENIRKIVAFLLSGNIAEVLIIFLAVLIGLPLPMIAIQILWINLITDGLPALALTVDPISREVMNRKPRPPNEDIISKLDLYTIHYPILVTIIVLISFAYVLNTTNNVLKAQTISFSLLVFFEVFQSFSCRSLERSAFNDLFQNKYLMLAALLAFALQITIIYSEPMQSLFYTTSLTTFELGVIIILAMSGFLYIELMKKIRSFKLMH